ncbi:hypothetical protein POPTR_007G048201v4 [Populus trichocarpa]|uniref:Uncharacterized protein n=1 Tax=Populus trichocarpa TaxID=3694 RepID=A0ACC0SQ95_POPTR|nr:hypothetical protein BDE02_07G044000 [Populus trichocarpa]KAI9391144.1 hypothetical protein POPTR_007G048201v4 [Populus trichocarpa]
MFISTSFAQRFFPFQMLWYCTLKRLCLGATTRDGKNWFLLCQRDSWRYPGFQGLIHGSVIQRIPTFN